ncbi:MAG: sensor histidine kinase [Chitinophagaceae bacterium]|nr:MAG: sensor histidine kinase [Chitinophagaceae bacterium]
MLSSLLFQFSATQVLLTFLPASVNLGIALYVFFYLPRNRITDIFGFSVLALMFWQISDGLYLGVETRRAAVLVDKVFSVSWLAMAPLGFHFACRYTGSRLLKSPLFLAITYGPFFILHRLYISFVEESRLVRDPVWGWVITPETHGVEVFANWFVSATMIVMALILLLHALRQPKGERRMQALLIAGGALVPVGGGILVEVVFPVLLGRNELPLTSGLITFFSTAVIVALRRYRLFDPAESLTIDKVLQQVPNLVILVRPDLHLRALNSFTERKLGLNARADALPLRYLFGSDEAFERFRKDIVDPAFGGASIGNQSVAFQVRASNMHTLLSAEPVVNAGQVQAVLLVANDISSYLRLADELKQSNEQRHREVTEAVIAAQENERRIIGAELHDNVNQILTSARLYLGMAVSDDEKRGHFLSVTGGIIAQAMQEVRKLSHSLIPPTLSGETLVEALTHLLESPATGGFEVELEVTRFDEESIPPKLKLTIYRIVQEQWSNIIKHASAQQVNVSLRNLRNTVLLTISDNGIGFDPAQHARGVGLKNIETRALLHGGRITVEAAKNKGCTLRVEFPLSVAAYVE